MAADADGPDLLGGPDPAADEAGIVTKLSPRPVGETVARLTGMVTAKGMKVFAVID